MDLGAPLGLLGLEPATRPGKGPQSLDDSLRRLQTDRLDICYLHRFDARVSIDEQFRTLAYVSFRGEGPSFARSAEATLSFQPQHELRTRDQVCPWFT